MIFFIVLHKKTLLGGWYFMTFMVCIESNIEIEPKCEETL